MFFFFNPLHHKSHTFFFF
uniref:Uncharacterized protein n=1 Tax=Anguilla anguilla TaxID=7936 RepID=A0A0E9W053_ANGAN